VAQFARPSTDTTVDNWIEDGTGDNAILWDEIDEAVADDTDFIRTVQVPTSDVYVTKLTALTDPLQSTGHIVRYRYRKDADLGATIDLTVQLRQGYTNEGAQGTLIHSEVISNIPGTGWTAGSFTLSGAEADAITDYANLYVRLVGNQV
jgi:hypothetical protein